MLNSVPAYIGLRYARASKSNHFIAFINLFSVIGIALGLMALIVVSSVMNGFEGQLKQRILGIMPHMVIDVVEPQGELAQQLTSLPQVLAHSQFTEAEGIVQSSSEMKGVMMQGVDPQVMKKYSVIANNMLAGSIGQLIAGEYGLIIGRALAQQLNVAIGGQVRLISAGNSIYTPMGRMPSQRKFTVTGIYEVGSELDDKVVLMHIEDAARLQRQKLDNVAKTRVFLEDAFTYQQVRQAISLSTDEEIDDWRRRQGPLFDAVKTEKNMMGLMLVLIIAVAAFNIISALVLVVTEKQGDIAILRTQGMSANDIMLIFFFNGFYNGIKGASFGLLGGLLLCSQLNNLLNLIGMQIVTGVRGEGVPVDVQLSQVMTMVGLSLFLCFIATLYPALRAVRVKPAVALRYE